MTLASCGWIRNKPKAQSGFQNQALDLTCLQTAPAQLTAVFSGNVSSSPEDAEKTKAIFSCLDHALTVFSSYTRGANPDSYSSEELKTFANQHLPADAPLTDSFVNSIFLMKRAVIGGTVKSLTKDEIKSLRSKLVQFGAAITPLAPHMRTLVKPAEAGPELRLAAGAALDVFVRALAEILANSAHPLEWVELKAFITDLEQYTRKGNTNALTFVREQIPVFQYAKLLFVGGSDTAIETEKWRPIFGSISHFYSAIMNTRTASDLLEQMSIEVLSTEEEQTRAVKKLSEILRSMAQDSQLQSRPLVISLTDRYAKALFINAIIFPRSKGSLALKPFLESAPVRKLAGRIVDQAMKIDTTHLSVSALEPIVKDLVSLIEQAGIADSRMSNTRTVLNLTKAIQYLDELQPLLQDRNFADTIKKYVELSKFAIPILVGNDGDSLSPREVAAIVGKAFELFATWNPDSGDSMNEKIGQTLETLTRTPSFSKLTSARIEDTLNRAQKILQDLSPGTRLDWDLIRSWLKRGMKLKALVFRTPETAISLEELSQLAALYEPLRNGQDLVRSLFSLSNILRNSAIPNAPITEVIDAVNSFLPPESQTGALGITLDLIRMLKPVLLGGDRETFSRFDYANLARLAANGMQTLYPKYKALGRDFKPGLDSTTFDLANCALHAFIDSRGGEIFLRDLKLLAMEGLKKLDMHPREVTVDRFLIGVYTRILKRSKAGRPQNMNGLTFFSSDLEFFENVTAAIRDELIGLEQTFYNPDGTMTRDELLGRLRSEDAKRIVRSIQPVLFGKDRHLHYAAAGETLDRFEKFDLTYKFTIHAVVKGLFPYYKVTRDPQGFMTPRLNEADLTDLLTDMNDLVTELKLSYGYELPAKSAQARLRSINLFTHNGNGDEYIDPIETTEFLTITVGGRKVLLEVEAELYPKCQPGIPNIDQISEVPMACLTRVFFQKEFLAKIYGEVAPELIKQVNSWDEAGVDSFRKSMLNAILPGWSETGSFPRSELESFVSVPHYTENLFQRFDKNRDNLLVFSELMESFPIFCKAIKKAGDVPGNCDNGNRPALIQGVFTYLIFHGKPPEKGPLLKWTYLTWPFMSKKPSVRDSKPPQFDRKDILKIMATLAGGH